MLAMIAGQVMSCRDGKAIIVTDSGLGFEVRVNSTHQLPEKTCLFTWEIFNDNTHERVLFGFRSMEELDLARMVAETDGVGPSKAHKLVTTAGIMMIIRAVQVGDISELHEKVSGFGPKTLKAIIATLKTQGKLESQFGDPRVSMVRLALSGLGIAVIEMSDQLDRILKANPDAPPDKIVKLLLSDPK